jgi:hypothetical protein
MRRNSASGVGPYTASVGKLSFLRTDLRARESAGAQLLRNPRVRSSAADASRLATGTVDSRLLVTLAAPSSQFKLRVMTFGDSSPLGLLTTVLTADTRPEGASHD